MIAVSREPARPAGTAVSSAATCIGVNAWTTAAAAR